MNIGIILAAGSGQRMGIDKPKQFIDVYGKPLLIHTLENFDINQDIDYIAIVCKEEWKEEIKIWIRKYGVNKVKWIINGGDTRQESIYNSLKHIEGECSKDDIVVIHDAARPLVSQRIISENIEYAEIFDAVDTVIPSADTIIKTIDAKCIDSIPERHNLYLGQTPQSFKYGTINDAHRNALNKEKVNATDDCQLVIDINKNVHLVKGEKLNFKITTFEDLIIFKSILKMNKLEVL